MPLADEVLRILANKPTGLTDRQLAEVTERRVPHVNTICRSLAERGLTTRVRINGALVNRLSSEGAERNSPRAGLRPSRSEATVGAGEPWFWEGNVQSSLCSWLTAQGWRLERVADTRAKERGTDVVATRHGVRLHVEVKGYPSGSGSSHPSTPAGHYFDGGLVAALMLREAHPDDEVALALPDMPRYRTRAARLANLRRTVRLAVLWIAESGTVESG